MVFLAISGFTNFCLSGHKEKDKLFSNMGEIDIVFVKNQSFCSLNVFLNIFLFFINTGSFLFYMRNLFSHIVLFLSLSTLKESGKC